MVGREDVEKFRSTIPRRRDVADSAERVVKSVCPLDCPDTCSMRVTVRDGVAVDLRGDKEHPFTRGALCRKMASYLDRVYSPDRLRTPLARVGPKGTGRFEPIGWDEALDRIAGAFRQIAESPDGPQAILPYSYYGTMGKLQSEQPRPAVLPPAGGVASSIGPSAPRRGRRDTSTPMGRGRLGADPMGVDGCKLVINWGSNTAQHQQRTCGAGWSQARKRGRDAGGGRPVPLARPPRGATGTSSPVPGPTPRSPSG